MNPDKLFLFKIQTKDDVKYLPEDKINIKVPLPNGEKNNFIVPAPTWSQRRWLKKTIKMPLEKKLAVLNGTVIAKNKNWETYTLLSHLYQTEPSIGEKLSLRTKQIIIPGVGISPDDTWSPISMACSVRDIALVGMMLACGADINTIDTPRRESPIINVLQKDATDEDMIQFILSAGAKLEETDLKYIKHANTLGYCKKILNSPDNNIKALPAPKKMEDTMEEIEDIEKAVAIDENVPTTFDVFSQAKQKITVKMPNGTTEELIIPAPTTDDIKWSNITIQTPKEKLRKEATKAITENNIWRILFLLEQTRIYELKEENHDFFDINSYGTEDSDLTLLGHTTFSDKNNKDAAILLIAYGADIERGKGRRWTPLINAISNDLPDFIELFIDNGASFNINDLKEYANKAHINNYFIKKFGNLLKSNLSCNLNDEELIEEYNFTGTKWHKLDNYTVAKTIYMPNKTKLNKIFNFEAQEIERFTEVMNQNLEVTAVSPSIIQSFNSIAIKAEIKNAHKRLCEQDGKPESIATYIRDTRRISKRLSR